MKPEKVCEISLKFQPSNTITTHPHSFKIIKRFSFYFPSFFPLLRLIIIFLFNKLVETSIQDCMKIISEAKRELPMIRIRLLKRKRKEMKVDPKFGGQWKVPSLVANGKFHVWWPMEGSMLGGQWKVPCLVANGRFHVWWPMECSKLGGQWKVPCLVANGRWKKNTFSSLRFSPPTNFT